MRAREFLIGCAAAALSLMSFAQTAGDPVGKLLKAAGIQAE